METFVDYENLLSRAACGLFECEPDGTLSYANQAYADLTGQAIPDLIGKRSFLSLLDPNTPEVGMGGPQSWLKALAAECTREGWTSLALPRLATGVGGMDWNEVKPLIEQHLGELGIPVLVYDTFHAGERGDEKLTAKA